MKKDIGFYIEAPIQQVYQAYLDAATNQPFDRSCREEAFHTISFGLNFSMKYNMNGGSCHIHFMPYENGTAINIHFSIVQAGGARCGKYAEDLNRAVQAILPLDIRPATYNADLFLRPENQVSAAPAQQPQTVAAPQSPAAAPCYCAHCGTPLAAGARFCSHCGTQVPSPAPNACPNCGTQAAEGARFCTSCGTQL